MIHMTHEGVELDIECISDHKEVEDLLRLFYDEAGFAELLKLARDSEEIMFSVRGANSKRFKEAKEIQYCSFHLDALHDVWTCLIFHVHKDHVQVAETICKKIRGWFKTANNWEETTRLEVEISKNPKMPSKPLDDP
jgi:hypothetical protein